MAKTKFNISFFLLLLISACLITIFNGACGKDETLEPPLTLDQKYYEGFEEDLRNFPEPGTERIFEKIDFVGMPKNEVLELLGAPSNTDANGNLPPYPDALLCYESVDGPDCVFHFREGKVYSVKRYSYTIPRGFIWDDHEGDAIDERIALMQIEEQEIDFNSLYYEGCEQDRNDVRKQYRILYDRIHGYTYIPVNTEEGSVYLTEVARKKMRRMYASIDFLGMPEQELLTLLGSPSYRGRDVNNTEDTHNHYRYCSSEIRERIGYDLMIHEGQIRFTRRQDFNEGRNCIVGPAFQDNMLDCDYPGIEDDLIAIRETYVDPNTGLLLSSDKSFDAARRLFRQVNYFEMSVDEVTELLGEPELINTPSRLRNEDKRGRNNHPFRYSFHTGMKKLTVYFEGSSSKAWSGRRITGICIWYDPEAPPPVAPPEPVREEAEDEIPANEDAGKVDDRPALIDSA